MLLVGTGAVGGRISLLSDDTSAAEMAQMHQMGSTKAVLRGQCQSKMGYSPIYLHLLRAAFILYSRRSGAWVDQ